MNPQDIQLRNEQLQSLANKLGKATDGADHSVLLESLLILYIVVAQTHDCCIGTAANALAIAALKLFTESRTCPQGASLH